MSFEKLKKNKPLLTAQTFQQIQSEQSRKRMGVVAQEVEKVVPKVVRTQEDGIKAVAYAELVGLLVEAMKEQQGLIDRLNLEVAELKSQTSPEGKLRVSEGTTGIATIGEVAANSVLSQNRPNPFTEHTVIEYNLASGAKQASVSVFDLQGKMLESYPAHQGRNSVRIEGATLPAGMYLYSLIVDGQIVDTKQMVLTK